jgi:predicted ester cyclase
MSNIDTFKAVLAAFEASDFKKAESLLADDMVLAGPMPEPVGRKEFVGVQTALIAALPDWKFNATDFKEQGDKVTAKLHINGNQTGTLNFPPLGIQGFPASGKHVQLPYEVLTISFHNGKVSRIDTDNAPGAGVPGVLAQIGVKMPMPQH